MNTAHLESFADELEKISSALKTSLVGAGFGGLAGAGVGASTYGDWKGALKGAAIGAPLGVGGANLFARISRRGVANHPIGKEIDVTLKNIEARQRAAAKQKELLKRTGEKINKASKSRKPYTESEVRKIMETPGSTFVL